MFASALVVNLATDIYIFANRWGSDALIANRIAFRVTK